MRGFYGFWKVSIVCAGPPVPTAVALRDMYLVRGRKGVYLCGFLATSSLPLRVRHRSGLLASLLGRLSLRKEDR